MRNTTALSGVLLLLTADASYAEQSEDRTMIQSTMTVTRKGTQAPSQGPAEYFTGSVRVEHLFPVHGPESRVSAANVTFQPGARSAWHTHPLGQNLIITAGRGWVQQEGGEKYEIRPGDVVWTPPGVKHWHGATPNERLTHIAIQEWLDGKNVQWMEKVTDQEYLGGKVAAAAQATPAATRSSDNEVGRGHSSELPPGGEGSPQGHSFRLF